MKFSTMQSFLTYYQMQRQTTLTFIDIIPPDKVDWAYKPGKFTIGDMIRHIAAIERQVFAEMALGGPSLYKGCGRELAGSYPEIIAFLNRMHEESLAIFKRIPDTALAQEITTLTGKRLILSDFLTLLIIHEVHHRAALCIYLNLLDVDTPPIIGLKEEQIVELSRNNPA